MVLLLAVLAIAVHVVVAVPTTNDLIISLPDGKVQGTTYITDNNKTFYGFHGIPYGTAPVGSLRFEAPQPTKPWDGVFDATKDGKACLSSQHSIYGDLEDEDCLNINVYTTSLKPAEKLPVMFWIFGGAFTKGNALKVTYGPDFFMEEDVVFVIFNYRLGPFGFLSTGDTAITGNFGLKDQHLALKWAKANVEYFGGDPDKITIFGESSGGVSTHFQLISEKSAGLFRAAIIESATAISPVSMNEDPLSYAVLLTEALSGGEYVNDTQKLKKFLQEKPALEIVDAAYNQILLEDGINLPMAWTVIEAENPDAFITDSPYVLLDGGKFNQVPIVIGICANEALLMLHSLENALNEAQRYDTDSSTLVPTNLHANSTDFDEIAKILQNMYLKVNENFTNNLIALSYYDTDNLFSRSVIKAAELHVKHAPVYLYQFAYYGSSEHSFTIDGAEKAGHASELPFLFKADWSNTTDPTDVLTQRRIVKLWSNFAKYLNPTPEESELLNNVIWPLMSSTEFEFLNINNTLESRSHLRTTYQEWTNIFETYGRKPFITF